MIKVSIVGRLLGLSVCQPGAVRLPSRVFFRGEQRSPGKKKSGNFGGHVKNKTDAVVTVTVPFPFVSGWFLTLTYLHFFFGNSVLINIPSDVADVEEKKRLRGTT